MLFRSVPLIRIVVALAPLLISHLIDEWQCSYASTALLSIVSKLRSHNNLSSIFPIAISSLHKQTRSSQHNMRRKMSSPSWSKRDMDRCVDMATVDVVRETIVQANASHGVVCLGEICCRVQKSHKFIKYQIYPSQVTSRLDF